MSKATAKQGKLLRKYRATTTVMGDEKVSLLAETLWLWIGARMGGERTEKENGKINDRVEYILLALGKAPWRKGSVSRRASRVGLTQALSRFLGLVSVWC